MVSLITTEKVEEYVAKLREAGCIIAGHDGHVLVIEDDSLETQVFAALQKGPGGDWIARFQPGTLIKWSNLA